MTKQTPKSCSCRQCKIGKHSRVGKIMLKNDERKHRHEAKISLNKGEYENLSAAPIGNYYD